MRVINKRDFKEEEFKLTCGKCFTSFAYTLLDTESYQGERHVKCPSCGKMIRHSTVEDYYNK